ncbi:MAG TPA: gliding motility-associated C-terminal domain-containing protein, partial [Cryomorphaceae bacterium]|nr:gliding motility-associated C-terminal domain-containing protein [Cryomorphaceae bacterium]
TADGSLIFDVTYRIFIENYSESPAQNIQVIENINGGLPVGATAQLIGTPSIAFGALSGGLNPNFDGVSDRALLPGNGGLPGSAADAIDLTIRVDMNGAVQDGYFNQVTVTSKNIGPNNGVDGPFNGQDFSHVGTNPDLNGNEEPNEEGENDPTLTCFFTNEIEYDAEAFCVSDGLQSVTIDGVSSGVFVTDVTGLNIDPETGVINPAESEPGTYEVTFSVSGRCPTTTVTTVTIVAVPLAGEAVDNTEVCFDQESINLFDYIEGEEEGGTWTNSNGDEVDETFNFTIPGNFEFTYTIVSEPCPAEEADVTINVIGIPQAGSPIDDLEVCVDVMEINLFDFIDGNQGGGQWFDGSMNPINETVAIDTPGTLNFTYEVANDACGARTNSFEITVVPESNSGISVGESIVCRGEELDLNDFLIDQDEGGVWTAADESEIDPVINFEDLGPFQATYTVQSPPCAPSSTTVDIEVVQGPNAGNPQNPVLICLGDPEFNLLEIMPGATFGGQWENESGELIAGSFNPNTEGTFSFTYTITSDDCGVITSELIVNVSDENCIDLLIPQGFSPNGDGVGDMWIIEALSQYPNNQLLIYNRWGGQVFAATPYNNDWDGKPNQGGNTGSVLPVGTYFYILDLGDGSDPKKGYVYLNR